MLVYETSELKDMKVAMSESNLTNVDLEGKNYGAASTDIKSLGLSIIYECRMHSLNDFQKKLYEKVIAKTPKNIALFADPIVVSFALKDACDISGVDYVWLDLEGENEVGCSAWVKEKDEDDVINLAISLLKRHLEKYLIDAYDRRTREDLANVWDTGLGLEECPVCGKTPIERRTIAANNYKFRGWTCSACGHHVIVTSDALDYLKRNVEVST